MNSSSLMNESYATAITMNMQNKSQLYSEVGMSPHTANGFGLE